MISNNFRKIAEDLLTTADNIEGLENDIESLKSRINILENKMADNNDLKKELLEVLAKHTN